MTRAGNATYGGPGDLPPVVPVFPLPGALLLPRRVLPLDVFEPRYLAMLHDVLAGDRLIGILQPRVDHPEADLSRHPALETVGCLGRLTQFAETGDGRVMIALIGVARFRVLEELSVTTPYRMVRADSTPFLDDFRPGHGEAGVDRAAVLRTLRAFVAARGVELEWKEFESAESEALVDGLAMMSPCGPKEKQAFLEAPDLASRADLLVAITERGLAAGESGTPHNLQ